MISRPTALGAPRRNLALASFLALAALIWACAGSEATHEPLAVSCENIKALNSYRYTINVKLKVASGVPTPSRSPQSTDDAFSAGLNAILSDFMIDGAHIAPDRTTAIIRSTQGQVEIRSIGNATWKGTSGKWQATDQSGQDASLLTPDVVCNDTVKGLAASFAGVKSQKQTIHGIETRRYHLDKADIVLPAGARSTVPETYQVDLWLANDALWPVKLDITAAATAERFGMEFQDINDPGIRIDQPVVSSPTPTPKP